MNPNDITTSLNNENITIDTTTISSISPTQIGDIYIGSGTGITGSVYTTLGWSSVDINATGNSLFGDDWRITNNSIDTDEVERMCKEYPSLEKVWSNFKSVYDLVKQDFEGKKRTGEESE
jgi:hypothetical protein